MVRAADAVFSLEMATPRPTEHLLGPLANLPELASETARVKTNAIPEVHAETPSLGPPSAAPVLEAEPVATALDHPPREEARVELTPHPRDPTTAIVIVGIIVGLVGLALLVMLFLS